MFLQYLSKARFGYVPQATGIANAEQRLSSLFTEFTSYQVMAKKGGSDHTETRTYFPTTPQTDVRMDATNK